MIRLSLQAPQYDAPVFGGEGVVESPSGLLDDAIESRRVNQEFIKSEVSRGLDQVRRELRANPGVAIVELKSLREAVRQAPDLESDLRGQLIDRIDTALRQANNRKVEKDQIDAAARERLAQDLERNRLRDQMRRRDDLLSTYIEQFNSRMDERRYDLATEASIQAFDVAPNLVATEAMLTKASNRDRLRTGHCTPSATSASGPRHALFGRRIEYAVQRQRAVDLPRRADLGKPDA